MTAQITFFGTADTFGYDRIGGTDSSIRRLSTHLATAADVEVRGVFYGADQERTVEPLEGVRFDYFTDLGAALEVLAASAPDHVVATYVRPRDRLTFARFRRRQAGSTAFHRLIFFYPEALFPRVLKFLEVRLFPYDTVFCVSQRMVESVSKFADPERVVYLPPPVDRSYFVDPDEKSGTEKIDVAFIGRVDPRKGVVEVLDLYEELVADDRYRFSIYGTVIEHDEEAVALRDRIAEDPAIEYTEIDRHGYTPEVDEWVREELRATDVFVQPYRTLDSTVDTPLLLLESMASLCAVLTRPVGDVGNLYGDSEFVIDGPRSRFAEGAVAALRSASADDVLAERKRVADKRRTMQFATAEVADRFLDALES